jgi:tetratricopeptide (TPR) repeat protein
MLFRDGKLAETIAELKQIPAENPDYARAQKLLASLTRKAAGAGADGTAAAPREARAPARTPRSRPPDRPGRPCGCAPTARPLPTSATSTLKSLNLAAPAFQSDPTFAPLVGQASEKVAELTPAVKLYNEGEYETAVPILWRIFQTDRANQDARSYLLRSYYNQGIAQLQNGLYPKAVESFKEVLSIAPEDAEATRHKKFAERYLKGDLDLMGRIYVRHITQKAVGPRIVRGEPRSLDDFPIREGEPEPLESSALAEERPRNTPEPSRRRRPEASPRCRRAGAKYADAAAILLIGARDPRSASPPEESHVSGAGWTLGFLLLLWLCATVPALLLFGKTLGMALAEITTHSGGEARASRRRRVPAVAGDARDGLDRGPRAALDGAEPRGADAGGPAVGSSPDA